MFTCMCACMGAWVYTQVCMYMCMHGCVCARVHVCAQVCVYGFIVHWYVCVHGCMCVCTGVCACVCGFGMIKTLGGRQILPWPWWTTTKDDSHSFFIFGLGKFQTVPTVTRQVVQWTISLNSCPMILCTWYMSLLKEQRLVVDLSRAGGPPRWRPVHTKAAEALCVASWL